ncbi:phosphotransferase enzyme family protein [Salinisphaera orenii]|nr:phosphotransferase [Salinisphaera halophila]
MKQPSNVTRSRGDLPAPAADRAFDQLDAAAQRAHLDDVARRALARWNLPADSALRLLSLSENATYRVDAPTLEAPAALRVHRTGYHSRAGIETELAWMAALREEAGIDTPQAIAGADGGFVQCVDTPALAESRFVDLFHFIPGAEPDENALAGPFEQLGRLTARLHTHAAHWQRPDFFERLVWDFDGCLGTRSHLGHWQQAPGLDAADRAVLEATAACIRERLAGYGTAPQRFGLIHADLRLANLLVDGDTTHIIDFDDCGLGWHLYDLATALSFIETRDDIDALVAAWLRGYREIGTLDAADEAEIPTFIMMRRMTLLGWIATHPSADMAIEQGESFARDTVALAERYRARFA